MSIIDMGKFIILYAVADHVGGHNDVHDLAVDHRLNLLAPLLRRQRAKN